MEVIACLRSNPEEYLIYIAATMDSKNNAAKDHWENIYQAKNENEVSWFQPYPTHSLKYIGRLNLPKEANIIDVGGGDSHLADALLDQGYRNIWVLDIAAAAIEKAKQRLGKKGASVHWIVSDITDFNTDVKFDCWHDRAAFHFLTAEEKITRYINIAKNAIKPNGFLIISTFSEKGPKKCSGLDIKQYSENAIESRFEQAFDKIDCKQEDHITPFNTSQNFLYCLFKKK